MLAIKYIYYTKEMKSTTGYAVKTFSKERVGNTYVLSSLRILILCFSSNVTYGRREGGKDRKM